MRYLNRDVDLNALGIITEIEEEPVRDSGGSVGMGTFGREASKELPAQPAEVCLSLRSCTLSNGNRRPSTSRPASRSRTTSLISRRSLPSLPQRAQRQHLRHTRTTCLCQSITLTSTGLTTIIRSRMPKPNESVQKVSRELGKKP